VRELLAPGNYARYRERAERTRNSAVFEVPEMLERVLCGAGLPACHAPIRRGILQ